MPCSEYDPGTDKCTTGNVCHRVDAPESCPHLRKDLGLSAKKAIEMIGQPQETLSHHPAA